jgi:hypothetical protein
VIYVKASTELFSRIQLWVLAAVIILGCGVNVYLLNWNQPAKVILIDLIFLACANAGVAAVLYGLVNLVKKAIGRGKDVKWGRVLWPMFLGALVVLSVLGIYSVE